MLNNLYFGVYVLFFGLTYANHRNLIKNKILLAGMITTFMNNLSRMFLFFNFLDQYLWIVEHFNYVDDSLGNQHIMGEITKKMNKLLTSKQQK